jgi:hypothetical protein
VVNQVGNSGQRADIDELVELVLWAGASGRRCSCC